jgi:hypothetical protein
MTYYPGPIPGDIKDPGLARYVRQELEKLANELKNPASLPLKVLHVTPVKPRDGMIVACDGTDLDLGSGAGVYEYRGGAWVKLG